MKSALLYCDCVIIGGGIAGLWLLVRLRHAGFDAVLIESGQLGGGQTLCSQGIIHGGVKYSLSGSMTGATRAIGAMPERWRRCLAGNGELDLSSARVLSEQQYLLTSQSVSSRLSGFFASQALQSHIQHLAASDYPEALQTAAFQGRVYRLHEPVLQTDSVLAALLAQIPESAVLQGTVQRWDNHSVWLSKGSREVQIQTRQVIWAAGAANATLDPAAQQNRPLHMVLARGALPELYAHCVELGDKPRLTITTHKDKQGRRVWYIGGALAENGIALGPAAQIGQARAELGAVFPWLDWSAVHFATVRIDRAEGRQTDGKRPDLPVLREYQGALLVWPTKLALAPLLADRVLDWLGKVNIRPGARFDAALTANWPRPPIADYPWERVLEWS